jgi:truncated hemoglobin YjbI
MIDKIQRLKETITLAEKDELIIPLERKSHAEIAGIFREQGDKFMGLFKKRFDSVPVPSEVEATLTDTFEATALEFERILKNILRRAYERGGTKQINDLQQETELQASFREAESFNIENARARQWIEQRSAEMITKIDETTRTRIKETLEDAAQNGWNYAKTARVIKNTFEEFAVKKPQAHLRNRAELVSATENGHAFEQGCRDAAGQLRDAGIPMEKWWSNTGDSRVSEGCMNNTAAGWIDIDETFPSGDLRPLRFPGCRCHALYRVKEEEL